MTTEPEVTQTPPPSEASSQCKELDIDTDVHDEDEDWDTDLEEEKFPQREAIPEKEKSVVVYEKACKKYGIIISSSFLRGLKKGKVNVNNQGLGPLGAKAVALSLVFDNAVTQLAISGNFIGRSGIKLITDMLKENDTITSVDISENALGSYGAELLSRLLEDNANIITVNISGNGFNEYDACFFGTILSNYKSGLKTLDLSHNQLSDQGGIILGKALASNETLQVLNLSWNNIRQPGIKSLFVGLKDNTTLQELDLSYNGIGDKGVESIAERLHELESLVHLDLSSNRIGQLGIGKLMKSVGHNKSLIELKLSKNPITAEGVCLAIGILKEHPECGLQILEIKDISVPSAFSTLLEELLKLKPRFRCKHGGFRNQNDIFKFAIKQREENLLNDPFMQLMDYVHQKKLRWVDLFYRLDTDKNLSISEDEFRNGIKSAGIPVTDLQIDQLIERLDANEDGEIDFNELLEGQKRYVRRLEKIFGSSPVEPGQAGRRPQSGSTKSRPSSSNKSRPSSSNKSRPVSRILNRPSSRRMETPNRQ
ncbi:uncharacterized protein LOC143067838 isoform X1 [Mytilus galloprovincialis]|uniref:uncharacterized protein LOC143067838 isoform X1 n=1 Tax=Mytilus galloprovincialis TaxID=29158 RepID=UPI003F7B7E47